MPLAFLKKIVILLVFSLSFSFTYAQDVILKKNFWIEYNTKSIGEAKLTDLKTSEASFHWRLSHYGEYQTSFIDIIKKTDSTYRAFATIYTKEYVGPDEPPTGRIFIKSYNLDTYTDSIKFTIENSGMGKIPSEEYIKGWGDVNGLDGEIYVIESKDRQQYSFKSYWTPSSIKVAEARVIESFISKLTNIINWKSMSTDFSKSVPYEAYTTSHVIVSKIRTKKEYRKLKKERDTYRKSLKSNMTKLN